MIVDLIKYACIWGCSAYFLDLCFRRYPALQGARDHADRVGKPMLNVGAGTWTSWFMGPLLGGDINCDISASREESCHKDSICYCDATDLSHYPDKHFGSLVALHILEHLDDPEATLQEWDRVADRLYVVVPKWWSILAFTHPGHMWYFSDGNYRGKKYRLRKKMSWLPFMD